MLVAVVFIAQLLDDRRQHLHIHPQPLNLFGQVNPIPNRSSPVQRRQATILLYLTRSQLSHHTSPTQAA
jgi:hypothetical protein